jgi:PAS domain S-box-containing protein
MGLNVTYISPSVYLTRGYTQEEARGLKLSDHLAPSSLALATRVLAEELAIEAREEKDLKRSRKLELEFLRKDGSTFCSEVNLTFIRDDAGKAVGILGVSRDITERKQMEEALRHSEERFRQLSAATFEGIGISKQAVFVDGNPQLAAMLGYDLAELIGKPVMDFVAPESQALVMDHIRRGSEERYEHFVRRKDGSIFPIEAHGRTMPWKGGTARVTALRDITERKRAEEEREELQFQLLQAQKMEAIGTLAGGIAHDFNNILASILGYAELSALDIPEDSPAKHNLQQSIKSAHRAKDLVRQILSFSRQSVQERKPLDIRPIVQEGLKFLRSSLPSTIEIRREMEEGLGMIEADPTQVYQVLMNLCTNAAHAMEERGGLLEVSLKKMEVEGVIPGSVSGIEPGAYVRLRVRDTGKGIAPEVLKRIFDPYFTTKEAGKGTGLGLAVVHGIVKGYGGGVAVVSEVGKGSTFDVYFPRVEEGSLGMTAENGESLPFGRRERVLFVDDEQAILEVGQNILAYLGYEVVVRRSSLEALELFRADPEGFDIVVTDMTMPHLTGDKLAGELLKIRPEIPIILCTGFSESITAEGAKVLGVREFAMKPLAMKDLAKTIRRVLDSRRKEKG